MYQYPSLVLVHRCHCHRIHIRHTCSVVHTVAENEGIGLERGALVSKGRVYVYILCDVYYTLYKLSLSRQYVSVYACTYSNFCIHVEFFRHSIYREDSSVFQTTVLSCRLLMMNKNKAIYLTY